MENITNYQFLNVFVNRDAEGGKPYGGHPWSTGGRKSFLHFKHSSGPSFSLMLTKATKGICILGRNFLWRVLYKLRSFIYPFTHLFIHSGDLYSASSRDLEALL